MYTGETLCEMAKRTTKMQSVKNNIDDIAFYDEGYAEPGYEGKNIAVGNWNDQTKYENGTHITLDDTMSRLANLLERAGYKIEWQDEWLCCSHCSRLVREKGDSYSWRASFTWLNDEPVCAECIVGDKNLTRDYLESLEGQDNRGITFDQINPVDHGYVLTLTDLENGFYGGQVDHPKVIAESLKERGITRFLFTIDSVGQFDMSFSLYVHEDQTALLKGDINTRGFDPAEKMKQSMSGV